MFRIAPARLLAVALSLAAGCGPANAPKSPADAAEEIRRLAVQEVGEMMKTRSLDSANPPSGVRDLARYEAGWQGGYNRVKDGDIVVVWGASPREDAPEKVLAFEKQAQDSEGYVLMQDGTTVVKMTADEFRAAPRAAGK